MSRQDVTFLTGIAKELIDEVIDNVVVIFKLSIDNTKTNIYGEGTRRVYYSGVALRCLVDRKDPQINSDAQTIDSEQAVSFNFLRESLVESKIYPEVGDLVEYHNTYYEINNVIENQLLEGQPYFNYSIRCEAHLTSRSPLQIEERIQ